VQTAFRLRVGVVAGIALALCFSLPHSVLAHPEGEHEAQATAPAAVPVQQNPEPPLRPTPQRDCGPGSRPERGTQGRVSRADHESGRAARGYTCNTEAIGHYGKETPFGTIGGFKVERYVDASGHDCAYYDTTLLFPTNILDEEAGVNVLDMSDPTNPVRTARLLSPAMLSPHESLVLSKRRGLLAAVSGNAAFNAGIVDVYDVSDDCRHPVLKSSTPVGVFGHESGMAPDGRTFYSASPSTETIVAVDISNPSFPRPLWYGDYPSHGLSISDDGSRAYVAGLDVGQIILDTSEIQARVPNPEVREVSRLTWKSMSIPQNAIPITIDGHPYTVEVDEFGGTEETGGRVGAARIIDIADEKHPRVVSNLRLEVHQPKNLAAAKDDPGAKLPVQGYGAHYCNVPRRHDPGIAACSMILSGLRVFDIRDPEHPREIAYFNSPIPPRSTPGFEASNWAMASPSFVPNRGEIWYSDGYSGFWAVRVTNGVWPFDQRDPREDGRGDRDGGGGTPHQGDADDGGTDAAPGDQGSGRAATATDTVASLQPGVGASTSAEDAGDLPFTGRNLLLFAGIALAVLTGGILLRRRLA
jgi:hypothetical protein